MSKSVISLLILLSTIFTAFAQSSRWRYLGTSSKGAQYYYDSESLRTSNEEQVTAWVRFFDKPVPGPNDIDVDMSGISLNGEDPYAYPVSRKHTGEDQWTIYKDRTYKDGWGYRKAIPPESMIEGLWRVFFYHK